MTVKELILKLQTAPQDLEVGLLQYTYQSCEDSCGSYDYADVEGVFLFERQYDKKFCVKRLLFSTEGRIGYPADSSEYQKI